MASILSYNKWVISLPGVGVVEVGNNSTPTSISLDSTSPDFYSNRLVLADNAEGTLMVLGSGEDMADFKQALILCSVDMTIGLAGSTDANNSTIKVEGGHYLSLTSDRIKPYSAVTDTRIGEANADVAITSIKAANDSGGTGYAQIWAVR